MVDDIRDILIDPDTRDIILESTNDIATTAPEKTVLQSVYIHIKNVVEPNIGKRATQGNLKRIATKIVTELEDNDPQIENVREITVDWDDQEDVLNVDISTTFNGDFSVSVPPV